VITRTGGLASAEEEIAAAHSLVEFQQHLRKALRELSAKPGGDLTSHVLLQNKQSDDPLSEDELLGFLLELFFAGNETSKTTIVAGMALMAQHPDQWTLLRQDRGGHSRREHLCRHDDQLARADPQDSRGFPNP
jgi:cytochrome P450